MPFYAHSRNSAGQRHELSVHLQAVARLAAEFAAPLGASEIGHFLGLWHDIGKFSPAFQEYLLSCESEASQHRRGPDHKAAGAVLAQERLGIASLIVQGHHGGLHDPPDLKGWLLERESLPLTREAIRAATEHIVDLYPRSQLQFPADRTSQARTAELFLRLLFSAVVDADYLDTETHFQADQSSLRVSTATLSDLFADLESHVSELRAGREGPVASVRRAVYDACLAAAEQPAGVFRLAAPTGSGKTLSAMAFALRHAALHGQQRVVVSVPLITITEQTADVYRGVFERDRSGAVLEHHSGADWDREGDDDFRSVRVWERLAAENWDALVIVTTVVQLFESLFARKPSRCRKLHRLANSVVIIDEAQALPPKFLRPILDALRDLAEHYNTTIVISTATQPAFHAIREFKDVPAIDILPDASALFDVMRRVDYKWPGDAGWTWEQAAERLAGERQALVILNTKKDAVAMLDALGDPRALHLSTLLCGAHRRAVIQDVTRRLAAGEPCRLVATQVVEAGVDLDFPFVMRAVGPLDSIIQAAGRCNREGRLNRGQLVVFRPVESGLPQGSYRAGAEITGALLGRDDLDPDNPALAEEYFRLLFNSVETDGEGIQPLREALNYPEVANRFRMIDDTESVVITEYGTQQERRQVRRWLDMLEAGTPDSRALRRKLQPYMVAVRRRAAEPLRHSGFIRPVAAGIGEWAGAYDPVTGLQVKDKEPDRLVT
jgi:CRISPR-associated endonuclease/helicase Cas3